MVSRRNLQNRVMSVGLFVLLAAASARVHLRNQTTLVGYRLGQLKTQEAALLENRNQLRLQLAKMTTKEHLSMISANISKSLPNEGSLASR